MTLLVARRPRCSRWSRPILLGRVARRARSSASSASSPASLAAPWWTYAVVLAVGLGLPPLMALVPLVRASRITVRAAIDHHGGGSKPSAATGVLARLSRIRRLDRGLLMALRNTVRRPARFWLSVGAAGQRRHGVRRRHVPELRYRGDRGRAEGSSAPGMSTCNWPARPRWTRSPPSCSRCRASAGSRASNVAQTGVAGPGQIPVTRTYPDQGHGRVVGDRDSSRHHHVHTSQAAGRPLAEPGRDRRGRAQPDHPQQHRPRHRAPATPCN